MITKVGAIGRILMDIHAAGDKNIIDAKGRELPMVSSSGSPSGFHKSIPQATGDPGIGIGAWRIVQVAAHDDRVRRGCDMIL